MQEFSTKNGKKIYKLIEKDLHKLIRKGAGKKYRTSEKSEALKFLALAADKDYTGKGILEQILQSPSDNKKNALQRAAEYQNFIQFLNSRLREFDLEDAAVGANVMADMPKYDHNDPSAKKRAYEMQVPGKDSAEINFNPGNNPDLQKVQDAIDRARDAKSAYKVFAKFAGSADGNYVEIGEYKTNVDELKKETEKYGAGHPGLSGTAKSARRYARGRC